MERSKLINIIAAVGLTSLVLLTFVGFSFKDSWGATDPTPVVEETTLVTNDQLAVDAATPITPTLTMADPQALQAQNAELQALLEQMVQREAEYQTRLQEANATILATPPSIAADPPQGSQLQAYQAQNAQLQEALALMQSREAEYQAQLEAANQQIQQQQQQAATVVNTSAAPASNGNPSNQGWTDDDDDDDDHDEDHDDDHDDDRDDNDRDDDDDREGDDD
jgi:hypothetical protein